jgi:hypothetical protein
MCHVPYVAVDLRKRERERESICMKERARLISEHGAILPLVKMLRPNVLSSLLFSSLELSDTPIDEP